MSATVPAREVRRGERAAACGVRERERGVGVV